MVQTRNIYEGEVNFLKSEFEKLETELNVSQTNNVEMGRLLDVHKGEIKSLQQQHENELQNIKSHTTELERMIKDKESEIVDIKETNRRNWETQIVELENMANDKKVKYLIENNKQLEKEVESLNIVLEMKNERLHSLERELAVAGEKLEELPKAKDAVRCLQQHLETIQVSMDHKIVQYNKLSEEHLQLKNEYKKLLKIPQPKNLVEIKQM